MTTPSERTYVMQATRERRDRFEHGPAMSEAEDNYNIAGTDRTILIGTIDELVGQVDRWKSMYLQLVEQYAIFLERYGLAEDATADDIILAVQRDVLRGGRWVLDGGSDDDADRKANIRQAAMGGPDFT